MSSKNQKKTVDTEKERQDEEVQRRQEEKRREKEEQRRQKIEESAEIERRKVSNKEAAERVKEKFAKKKNDPYFYYYIVFGVLGVVTLYALIMTFFSSATPLHKLLTIDESKIEEHNNAHPWKRGPNKIFEGTTLSDAKKIISTTFASHSNLARCSVEEIAVPLSFDARTKWNTCVSSVRSQGLSCGSGYAFAASEALAERVCIASQDKKLVNLSAQELLSCDTNNSGCTSGYLNNAADYLKNTGLVENSCLEYSPDATCDKVCKDNKRVKIENYCILFGEEDIKKEIVRNGSVFTAISVHTDFLTYKSGVYTKLDDVPKFSGLQAVKIVGWGVERGDESEPNAGNKYWIVQNYWGEDWGENGFAKISTGQELMFDQYAYAIRLQGDKAQSKPETPKAQPAPDAPVEENLNLEDVDDKKKTDI